MEYLGIGLIVIGAFMYFSSKEKKAINLFGLLLLGIGLGFLVDRLVIYMEISRIQRVMNTLNGF